MKTVTIKIPDELYYKLISLRNDIDAKIDEMFIVAPKVTVSSIVRDAIENYLNDFYN